MRPVFPATALLALLALGSASNSRAQFVAPIGYAYGETPASSYPDNTGIDLINGTLGISFSNTFDSAQLAAWTGWQFRTPSIDFHFAAPQTFSRVEIGTTRWDPASVGPLTSVTIGSFNFTTGIALANDVRDWVVLDGNFSTTLVGGVPTLTITLTGAEQWIMLDEVRFTAIPETAQSTLLFALPAVAVTAVIRRKTRLSSSAG